MLGMIIFLSLVWAKVLLALPPIVIVCCCVQLEDCISNPGCSCTEIDNRYRGPSRSRITKAPLSNEAHVCIFNRTPIVSQPLYRKPDCNLSWQKSYLFFDSVQKYSHCISDVLRSDSWCSPCCWPAGAADRCFVLAWIPDF